MKIIKVENCGSCPLREMDEDDYKCFARGGNRRITYPLNIIPKWCPLEDYNAN